MAANNFTPFGPDCVQATYTEQRLPQFKGNPLIEALPPSMSDEELFEALTLLPDFAPEQRSWPTHERIHMLETLQNFMVPLSKHLELARAIDSMMRAGYVGRAPRTPEHAQIFQSIYEKQQAGIPFRQSVTSRTPQLSTSLVGLSGMGKTTTVNRWCAHLPRVIYHQDLNVYQVPYLHVEMPSDGSSIKGLAHGILQKLDELLPGANYFETYAGRSGRTGADSLMRSVARVMNMHLVGLLICDEVQNLSNANKGGQTVMTELVSACNDLKVPILFIGTNKAAKVLSLDFRQSRRASGHGITPWDRFYPQAEPGEINEWREFVEVLWAHQWTRKPTPLDEHLLDVLHYYSQGVIDIAIKIFASSQARAMLDGSETLTAELISDVYNKELKLLHPMIGALRAGDTEALMQYDDIAPISLSSILGGINHKLKSKASPLYTVKSGDPSFVPRIATSLVAIGLPEEEALAVAEQSKDGMTLIDAHKAAVGALTTPKRVPRAKPKPGSESAPPAFDDRPNDYRRAIHAAWQNGSQILDELKVLGMAMPLEELFALE
ncbi:MAG: ATP-binding protein [Proteobacteria bacterium]|nr:ATP-binding protein [Pseudomonadota bacterium]